MPSIVTAPGSVVTNFPTQTVEKIDYLGAPGGWVTVSHLYCDKLRVACNGYDEAELSYVIGQGVVQPGTTSAADYYPLSLRGKFIRITINTAPASIVWVGYVLSDDVIRDGVKSVVGVNKLTGRAQLVTAVGLEWFLDRKQITQAVIRNTGASPDTVTIERPLTFNGGVTADLDPGSAVRGNRSQAVGGTSGVYEFTDSFEGAPLWTARQIVDHCVYYYTMQDSAAAKSPCPFYLHGSDVAFLDGITPTVRSEGLTVYQVLNKICTPQRGLVWFTQYDESISPRVFIRLQSLAASAVSLPGGGTLPANTNQETVDFDTQVDVARVKYSQIGFRDYHQVVVRGARMTSTCTVGLADNTLIEDWSQLTGPDDAGTEKKYKDAAKNDAGYSSLTDEQKKKRNDAFRRSEAFYRVYSAFRIPSTWDGKTGDGGGGTRNYALPELSTTGSVIGTLAKNAQGLRMLNTLRLKRGWDYSNPTSPKSVTPTSTLADLMPPFAFIRVAYSPDRFQFTDKLKDHDFAVGTLVSSKIKTSYHLHMQHTTAGIRLTASGSMPHAIASFDWNEAPLPEPSNSEAEIDFRTLRATVCLEADKFCEGVYPDAGLPANTPLQILTIDAGEHYRLDFLAENTVVGINNGQLQKASHAKALRDDRVYLRDFAKLAYQWYQENRYTLTVSFRQLRNVWELGMFILTIGELATQSQVNTVVSTITYDLINGTTTVETEDQTLDVRSLVA